MIIFLLLCHLSSTWQQSGCSMCNSSDSLSTRWQDWAGGCPSRVPAPSLHAHTSDGRLASGERVLANQNPVYVTMCLSHDEIYTYIERQTFSKTTLLHSHTNYSILLSGPLKILYWSILPFYVVSPLPLKHKIILSSHKKFLHSFDVKQQQKKLYIFKKLLPFSWGKAVITTRK